MKWRTKESKLYEKLGETRIIKRFALWPKTLNGERRWLEFYHVKQELKQTFRCLDIACIPDGYKWVDQGFCNKDGMLDVPQHLKADVLAPKISGKEGGHE